jgi:LysR family glycine cleavage system transcriptional activator
MPGTTHLKSLQALELAIRCGSLKTAAERLGISPAAVGQRIRMLETYLGADLLVRGRSGIQPTALLGRALGDLQSAFTALERVTEAMEFQRVSEIQVIADADWAELWLLPRLPAFREAHPNTLFCINGIGDVPMRLGAPDLRVFYGAGDDEALFTDVLLPVAGPDNLRRYVNMQPATLEGMPLLHLTAQLEDAGQPGWVEWFEAFGERESGRDRGIRYLNVRLALEAVRREVGFLLCGLSLVQRDFERGTVSNLFPMSRHIAAPHPYRMKLRADLERRPPVRRFVEWLRKEARETSGRIAEQTAA